MDGSHRFPPRFPPPFASAWGDDQYGLWANLEVPARGDDHYGLWADLEVPARGGSAIVTQRLRWIEPGTFVMGSPETEAERFDSEGPRHEVTISKGFWLFDTACPQALWEAVMGGNPSFFNLDRPVTSVSWNDVQVFLARINRLVPGSNLVLPSEAQWEYACRAGTTTPFSFGEMITPEQVNYDGTHPYAGGETGLYRQETVPVASLPPNPWGLYEMHGNVWEWCADHWHDSYEGAPADGSAWIDPGTDAGGLRVFRGGPFNLNARFARSAYRGAFVPSLRGIHIGFRCARVQEP